MKIAALFTDYDGTIAPAGVRREESAVPRPLFSVLEEISSTIPVAIITSKDVGFVRPRTGFAWGWAGALGLELRSRDGGGSQADVRGDLAGALAEMIKDLGSKVILEEKRGTDGTLLGASLDWSWTSDIPPRGLDEVERKLRGGGFQVTRYQGDGFMDVYAAPADKGAALRALVEMLGIAGPVMYLGDTEADNPAFEACDVGVCVRHSQPTARLRSAFAVRFEELAGMLRGLLSNGLEFSKHIIGRTEAEAR